MVLVGPSGSGKSTWAAEHFRPDQIVSSDALRAVVGEGPHDLAASADAFAVLEEIVARRVRRRLTTVVDTLGLEPERRRAWLSLARAQRLPCVAVGFDTPAAECRSRNRRRDVPVPAKVLTAQLQAWGVTRTELPGEGFDAVLTPEPVRVAPPSVAAGSRLTATQRERPVGLRFGLHVPAFTWSGGPSEIGPRLRAIAVAAEQAGFDSLWVLDHFRQIPLFGRPWEDMLESYTALAHLAAVTERRAPRGDGDGHHLSQRRPPREDRGHARRPVRWTGGLRPRAGLDGGRAPGLRLALPVARRALRPPRGRPPAPPAAVGPGHTFVPGSGARRAGGALLSPARCRPRCRSWWAAGASAAPCGSWPATPTAATSSATCRSSAASSRCCAGTAPTPAATPPAIEVTQLSTTLVGRDAAEVDALVERHRPRRVGAERYAAHVNAGTVADQVGRFRALADEGVELAVVSLPDLDDTAPVERFASVIDRFR